MVETVAIPLRRLSLEAFAPFGQIIGSPAGPPVFGAQHLQSWRLAFDVEGAAELMLCRYAHQRYELTTLERHLEVTQSFVALGAARSVMVVAAATARDQPPAPEAVHAYHVPGDVGLMLWRGTWHALTRFPVSPSGAAFLMVTGRETQRELERQQDDGTPPRLTQVVDFEERSGLALRVVDPERLLED